jgi:hypothetical protein
MYGHNMGTAIHPAGFGKLWARGKLPEWSTNLDGPTIVRTRSAPAVVVDVGRLHPMGLGLRSRRRVKL